MLLPGLPAELDGLAIVHISDLHYGFGRFCNEDSVAQITRLISSLDPDLIVFTGDLLDRSADPALAGTLPLEGLKAPLGVYAVMGNHDHHFSKIARYWPTTPTSGSVLDPEVVVIGGTAHTKDPKNYSGLVA